MTNSLPLTALYSALEKIIEAYGNKIGANVESIEIKSFIPEQLDNLKTNLISNIEINKIVKYALDEIIINWKSLYMLEFQEPANMHFRKIMECMTVLLFLMENKDKWSKYSKKWENYPQVESFRRWSYLERNLWHPETEQNFKKMLPLYKEKFKDFEIFFKKGNLTGNLEVDLAFFKNVDSWISPKRFSNLLETMYPDGSSLGTFYGWWSNSVHFSPLNYAIKKVDTDHGNSMDIGLLAITLELSALVRKLSVISTKFENYYYLASIITYTALMQDAVARPEGFIDKLSDPDDTIKALFLLASGKITVDKFISYFQGDFENFKKQNSDILT